jgi:tRNA(Ile)-lysidine synthetase-like protein
VFELPRGVVLTVDPDVVILSVGPLVVTPVPPDLVAGLPWSGAAGGWRLDVAAGGLGERLSAPEGAIVRARRSGDVISLAGGRKKLQDAYVDAKVPRRERDAAPVIAAGGDVLWTPFMRARASGGEEYVIAARRI